MALDSNGSDELDAVLAVLDEALGVDSQLSLQSIASCDSRANRSSSATLKPKQTSKFAFQYWLTTPSIDGMDSWLFAFTFSGRRNPRPEGFDPNKARRAMNREIQELRASAKVLTERLEAVRAVVADRDGKPIPGTCALGQNGSEEEKVWFELNQSQLAQRLEAAAENTRLKRAIEEATRIVHSFQEAATKSSRALVRAACLFKHARFRWLRLVRCDQSQRGVGASLPSKVHVLLLDSEEDTKMFEMMVKEVDASYDEAPEAFRVNNLVYTSDEPRFGVQMHEGNRGRFMDMFSETVLPFALEDTSRVVWEFYSGPAKHRGQVYFKTTKVSKPHNTGFVFPELFFFSYVRLLYVDYQHFPRNCCRKVCNRAPCHVNASRFPNLASAPSAH